MAQHFAVAENPSRGANQMKREPETVLQPSLHTIREYVDMVISEAECRGVDVADIRKEYDADHDGEFIGEMADDVLSRLHDAGYANVEDNDTLLIMPKGEPLPSDWQE
jgi:hypothetical protein